MTREVQDEIVIFGTLDSIFCRIFSKITPTIDCIVRLSSIQEDHQEAYGQPKNSAPRVSHRHIGILSSFQKVYVDFHTPNETLGLFECIHDVGHCYIFTTLVRYEVHRNCLVHANI